MLLGHNNGSRSVPCQSWKRKEGNPSRSLRAFSVSWTQQWWHECAALKLEDIGMKSEQESPNSTSLKLPIEIRTKSPLPGSA